MVYWRNVTTGYVIPQIQKQAASADVKTQESETGENVINAAAVASLDEASKNTIELVKRVKPSIACITTKTTSTMRCLRLISCLLFLLAGNLQAQRVLTAR